MSSIDRVEAARSLLDKAALLLSRIPETTAYVSLPSGQVIGLVSPDLADSALVIVREARHELERALQDDSDTDSGLLAVLEPSTGSWERWTGHES